MAKQQPTVKDYVTELSSLLQRNSIKPGTVKAREVEVGFLTGAGLALGGMHNLPPVMLMCGLSGRSILTIMTPPTPTSSSTDESNS